MRQPVMKTNLAPLALLVSEQTMRIFDSSQASPLRKPRYERRRTARTLYNRYFGAAVWTRTREVSSDLLPTRCLEKDRQKGGEQLFGCETSAGGVCNTGGFLMRFFWEKNTPQHNRPYVRTVRLSQPRDCPNGITSLYICQPPQPATGVRPRAPGPCATDRGPRWLGFSTTSFLNLERTGVQ